MSLLAIYYSIVEKIFKYLSLDYMKYRIKKYRHYGARIGENVRAFSSISSPESYLITVGDNVTISTNVKFITHDNSPIKLYADCTDFVGPITIGNNVFIGANSILLPGITIANNCIIGAGSVVCKSILVEGMIVAGNPAKVIGSIDTMKDKYENYKFDFRGKDRKAEILAHPERWLKK